MFQNQINNVFNEIKSYYSVLSTNTINKIEKLFSKNDLKALLEFCKSENNSIFQKIEGKLELLISIIEDFNVNNDNQYIYSYGLNKDVSNNFSDYMIVKKESLSHISIAVWGYNEEALILAKSIIKSV